MSSNVDRRLRKQLSGHNIRTTRECGWEKLSNGILLKCAADSAFDAFLSVDKNIEHQQNLGSLPLPVIVLDSPSNALPAIVPFAPAILDLLKGSLDRALYIIQSDGVVLRLTAPRGS
jgi:hypothetical protein